MAKVLVLYYSSYGHIEKMAYAVAEGVRQAGAEAVVKRVPELVPEEVARKSGFKLDQPAPVATVSELADYDAIIFGTGTRFGNMTSQMKNFLDQAGGLWVQGKLVGKVGSVFTSSATRAWRTGIDDPDVSPGPAAPRDDDRRAPLRIPGPDRRLRGDGQFALRRLDHRRRRRQPPTLRGGARRRALSRPARGGDRCQTALISPK